MGKEAGLGWQGKHSILINRKIGSFFFLGIIILNIELDYDKPAKTDYCGKCRLCIEICPTGAINDNRTIDARKCIAYLTLESKSPIPEDIAMKLEGRILDVINARRFVPGIRMQNHIRPLNLTFRKKLSI